MINRADKLVEATILALQGKLELKENKRVSGKTKKSEGIDVNVDNTTTVSVEGNETIVDTEDATVIVNKKEDEFIPETSDDVSVEAPVEEPVVDAPVAPDEDTVEVPADDTVMPEEVVDEPVDTELPTEESKKFESVEIEVSDDGKEVEVTTDNGEEVEVKDETPEGNEDGEIEDIETEISADDEPSIDEMIEENKKVTEGARDIADIINNEEWYDNNKRKQTLRGMLANKIADVADEMGDDYSEWVSEVDFDEIIEDITNSPEWRAFDEKLNEIIAEAVEDKVDWTRRDEPASRYYTGNPDLEESKKVEDTEEYLEPRYDTRNSFYKKAKVVTKDNGDEELYSYGTHVGGVRGGKPYSKGKFSQTTSRHQKEFFKQRGVDPKKVDVEEGKQADRNEEEINAKKSKCINCENKDRSKKVQEMIARRQKKLETKNDLDINEGTPKTEEEVPNTSEASLKVENKFSSKSFNEVLTKYYRNRILALESVEVTKLSRTRQGLKLEANLINKRGNLKKAICLELKQIQTGKSFDKYELIKTKGLVKENKSNNNKVTMTTFKNKNNVIECRYILSK